MADETVPTISDAVGPIRFRRVGEHYLLTNDAGAFTTVEPIVFEEFVAGRVEPELFEELRDGGFVRQEFAVDVSADRLKQRFRSLSWGPHSHLINVGAADDERRMSAETAERCVDFVFKSTSPRLTIAFNGPRILSNHAPIERAVVKAKELNCDEVEKEIGFELWSDLGGLDDARFAFLVEHRFHVRAVLDAAALADESAPVRGWVKRFVEAYAEAKNDPGAPTVDVVIPCGRAMLDQSEAIVATAVSLGCRRVHLWAPLPPPVGLPTGEEVDEDAWLAFYLKTVDGLVAAHSSGAMVAEQTSSVLLKKILGEGAPFDLHLRSPATDGIGQLSYAWDGTICSSDVGRALWERGDPTFRLGKAGEDEYRTLMGHPTVRAMVVATALEGQPGCTDCTYMPYCGQSPTHNWCEQGSIQGRMADSSWCKRMITIQDRIFEALSNDPKTREVYEAWGASLD